MNKHNSATASNAGSQLLGTAAQIAVPALIAIALALRARAPIYVEDAVIDNAKTVDLAPEKGDSERLQKWLENLDPDAMGKYKM